MSFASLTAASRDEALIDRTNACAQQEARDNPELSQTAFAAEVRAGSLEAASAFIWPVALNTEAEYAYALANGVENPGADETVITDAMILAAVQASWPSG